MGDEEVGELAFLLEFQQQVEHLGLDGYVQRRDGFIQNDEAGVQRQGACDADALALAPGEFKGEAVDGAVRHAYAVQQAAHPFPARGGCAHAVDDEGLRYNLADGLALVEGFRRVLEDHLNMGAQGPHFALGERGDVFPLNWMEPPVGFSRRTMLFPMVDFRSRIPPPVPAFHRGRC